MRINNVRGSRKPITTTAPAALLPVAAPTTAAAAATDRQDVAVGLVTSTITTITGQTLVESRVPSPNKLDSRSLGPANRFFG
ncbi:hypothetical protein PoB_006086700 [Plakobranchus ocellatus]|uniref:TonB-dependent receptor n=1 Tax=Plakobranchus ocellatus TaxID=259542 RepID=A0AAV4CR61_9GAST|nr:hypothetical protein PoB_006086700 [Plakobranchus ocellatus]